MEKSEIETIYRKYFHDVFLYIRALSENESLAEEITQETFLKAMNNIEKFDEDFMFELTDDEVEDLRSNFLTARQRNCWYLQRLRNALCWQIRLQGITFTRHSCSLINCMLK